MSIAPLVGGTMRSLADRFWSKVEKTDTCWLWRGAHIRSGHGRIWCSGNRYRPAHQVSWELAYGPIADGMWALHHCDVANCVRPEHLYLGNHKDNVRDAVERLRYRRGDEHGLRRHPEALQRGERHWSKRMPDRVVRGERTGSSKLTRELVMEIRRLAAAGERHAAIAETYGVARQTVGDIASGRRWAWL